MPLAFDAVFSIAIISQIECIRGGEVGGSGVGGEL